MGKRINWKERIKGVSEITDIDVNYCFLNDIGHGDFELDKFSFDKETGLFWIDKEGEKAYRDADAFSVLQYRYYEIFLNRKLPDGIENKFVMRKVGSKLELCCTSDEELTLSCDYIGPIKKSYYINNKFDSKNLAKMLLNTRNFAGSIVWPNNKESNFTVNQAKGFLLKDRMDLTLLNLKAYMDSDYKLSSCMCSQLGQAFEDNKEWYKHFKSFEGFINYFFLNDFVNREYEIICFDSYDAYLIEIEQIIKKRKMRLNSCNLLA